MPRPAVGRGELLRLVLPIAAVLIGACSPVVREPATSPSSPAAPAASLPPGWADLPPVLVGAGDIAMCRTRGDEATARLVDDIPGVVMVLGYYLWR